ncbi:MAG TPA: hypothetical protein VLF21_01905 [Candidatus Saccharimonadales bacterium]|nr:hypothetical protein [Candidatus Saccharimonadales bacterium]
MNKSAIWVGAGVGGVVGGYIPSLWHADFLSPASILGSTVGGLAGIWVIYKLYK